MTAPAPWTQEQDGSAQTQPSSSSAGASFERADCCSARALFRVVLPPTQIRSRGGELLLCGHHLRMQHAALVAARAVIFDPIGAATGE